MPRSRRTGNALAALIGLLALVTTWSTAEAGPAKKRVDWAALNPAFQGATFVNDPETCRSCHDDAMKTYSHTAHATAFGAKPPAEMGECESCHGPRSKHVEAPTAELKIDAASGASSAICLQCHEGGSRFGWKAGPHAANDVTCTSCHTVMAEKSERALLASAAAADTCVSCHAEIRVEFNKMSHHPVKEGRMDCAGCHNVHGSLSGLLTKPTMNDTCYTCHAEKRGPFVWEHAPARESCGTCHTPHGSNQRTLLTSKDPFLCLSCHNYGGHINLPRYNRTSNPYGNGCSNCHITMHGSNHPSGAKLTR
jgi:DmsE family decaheme c-type cytochrome